MAKPKAIITGHDGREVSIITKAENVLFDNGNTAQSILETDLNKTFTPTIESSKSMFKVGQGDSVDYSLNAIDGAYESCVLKGVTKYIDKDTSEILDTFIEGRNLSLIDVKSPILSNVGKNLIIENSITEPDIVIFYINKLKGGTYTYTFDGYNMNGACISLMTDDNYNLVVQDWGEIKTTFTIPNDGKVYTRIKFWKSGFAYDNNTMNVQLEQGTQATTHEQYKSNILTCETYYDEVTLSNKPIVLRSLPSGVCDTLNVETGEYIVEIGKRAYQVGDLELLDVYTDGVTTHYKLTNPIVRTVNLSGFPYAYTNGHVILSSGYVEQSLTPKVEYSLPINRNGQIQVNQKMVEKQQKQLDYLEKIIIANVVVSEYEQTLTSLNYELSRV